MKLQKNKTLTSAALILILAAATLMVTIPAVSAHDPPWDINTFGFISVAPDKVGVNQQVIMYMWLHIVPPTASGPYGDRWKGFTLDVTKPDASVETLGPFNSDPIGFAWTLYTPTQVGTYSLQFHYPGQVLEGENLDPNDQTGREFIGDYYQPCSSDPITLTVQQDQIPAYPDTPLPTDYWDRPIDGQHRDWWSISGNWLRAPGRNWVPPNMYVPYSNGPETPHILWANSLTSGGLVGGEFGTNSFHDGNAYEGKFMPVIIAGRLYYNQNPDDIYANRAGRYPAGEPWTVPKEGVYSVDLRTGEEYWFTDEFRLAFGQIYQYDSPNQHGAFAYLWEVDGSTWNGFEAFNGQWIYTIENVPGGTHTVGPDGSIYKYQLDTQDDRLTLWSNTAMTELVGGPTGTHYWQWRPQGKTVDGSTGYLWNVSIPADLEGGINVVLGDRIIGTSGLGAEIGRQYYGTDDFTLWCLSLKPGEEGKLLWKKDYTGDGEATLEFSTANLDEGVFTLWSAQMRAHWGYSIETGEQIWGPTESQANWDMTVGTRRAMAAGKLLSVGYSGIVYAYTAQTGKLEWTYKVECPYYLESKWGGTYIIDEMLICDGKVYLFTAEHSPDDPKERGSPVACVDLESGEELWSIPFYGSHWSRNPAIADGILVWSNTYDNQIYAFGKGQTAVTVEAPLTAVPDGTGVMIRGTVTDQSPGAKDTPAIADASMSEWMQYLYMQFPMPMDATGVPVTLDAVGPDGSFISIGTVNSDASGMFKKMWTPPSEGEYTIIATFAGSGAYWSSYAETSLGVSAESTTLESSYDLYILVAVIILIAIVLIFAFLVFRKQ